VQLDGSSAAGILQTLEALPRRMEATLENVERNIDHFRQEFTELQALSGATFEHQEELDRLLARQRELDALLGEQPEDRRTDLGTLDVAEVEAEEEETAEAA
jgi:multidrug resistance efflux pump